jgi:hypothetical protein
MASQTSTTASRRRPRLSIEKLLDKAERLMQMKGATATAAVRQSMPDELLDIPMDVLRSLAESALVARLAQRRSKERYRETENRAEAVRRLTMQVLQGNARRIQEKAEVLARVTYVMHGVPTPLMLMTLDDHVSKRVEAQKQEQSAKGRFKFHDAAVKALKDSSAESIAQLPLATMEELADLAGTVWGGSSAS